MEQIAGRFDQPSRLLLTENDRQPPRAFRIRQFFERVGSLQRLDEQEAQARRVQTHWQGSSFLFEQMRLVGADLGGPELIRLPVEMLSEVANDLQVRTRCSLRVLRRWSSSSIIFQLGRQGPPQTHTILLNSRTVLFTPTCVRRAGRGLLPTPQCLPGQKGLRFGSVEAGPIDDLGIGENAIHSIE